MKNNMKKELSMEDELKEKSVKELRRQLDVLETLHYDYELEIELIIDELKRRKIKGF
jgi:hypothetical protein